MLKQFRNHDLGLFLLRAGLAVVFIAHGWQKFSDLPGTVMVFEQVFHLHPLFAYLVATVELVGGLALLLGIETDLAAGLLAVDMISAIYIAKYPKGLIGGYEFELVLLTGALAVLMVGAGRHTIKEWMRKR